ncbi:MAG: hypothetical protein HFF52_03790 [Lawsonibacter sp.]|nr:hypothetical protein [Lawsonibacter sp.]
MKKVKTESITMKKKTLAIILTLCMTVAAVVSVTVAGAAGGLQEIKAYLNSGVTIKVDGEEQIITESNGVRTYPIVYNGTNYVPIRSVANLLGVDVDWDQSTNAILLGKQPNGVDLIDTYKNYQTFDWSAQYQTGDKDPMEISGVSCSRWLTLGRERYHGNEKTVSGVSFNLGGKHDTLTFSYYSNRNATLQVLGDDGAVLFEKDVTGGQVAQTVTIPLFKTNQLTFQITNVPYYAGGDVKTYIFDAYLDVEQ